MRQRETAVLDIIPLNEITSVKKVMVQRAEAQDMFEARLDASAASTTAPDGIGMADNEHKEHRRPSLKKPISKVFLLLVSQTQRQAASASDNNLTRAVIVGAQAVGYFVRTRNSVPARL